MTGHGSLRPPRLLRFVLTLVLAGIPVEAQQPAETWPRLITRLSEPGGHFDSDNLISNERSYLHVLDGLRRIGTRGGAYIGVGPDQNFSYIAKVRPEIAYLIDIRRDNQLLHLLFKAIFLESPTRVEYLALLFGRPPPSRPGIWSGAPAERLVTWLDSIPLGEAALEAALIRVRGRIARLGVSLSDDDHQTIQRFHLAFMNGGLDLRFSSAGRGPRPFYPTYRDLMLETDRAGNRGSFLAAETDYRFVRRLQQQDRIVPVVGDLAGDHALRAIGRDIAARRLRVSVFYTSNVEFYLFGAGSFDRFAATVRELPRDRNSLMLRSWFGRFARPHPHNVPGYGSTQVLQTMDAFLTLVEQGGYLTYWDVATHALLPPE